MKQVKKTVLAIDLGTESGGVMAVLLDGRSLQIEKSPCFLNIPVTVNRTLQWDIIQLWLNINNF